MVGQVSKGVDEVFMSEMAEVTGHEYFSKKKWVWEKEVPAFVEEYYEDRLFDFIPGREHRGFSRFKWNMAIPNPGKFKQRLRTYSQTLDSVRDLAVDS